MLVLDTLRGTKEKEIFSEHKFFEFYQSLTHHVPPLLPVTLLSVTEPSIGPADLVNTPLLPLQTLFYLLKVRE